MALVLADRVRETTTVTGTGTATLLGAVSGYQSFAAVGNANTTYYVIANQSASEWEVGIGTYTSSGTTLSRTTVLSSSNSGSLVNFSAGTKDVFVDYPAGRAVYENETGNVDGYPITGGTINGTTVGATTPAAGTFTTLTAQTEVLKGTGQNFCLYSEQFDNAYYGKFSASVTANSTTSPTGTTTADTLVEDSSTNDHGLFRNDIIASGFTSYVLSVYAKASGRNFLIISLKNAGVDNRTWFNVSTGVIGTSAAGNTASITNVGNGWYRCSVTRTFIATQSAGLTYALSNADNVTSYTGDGTSGVYIWGSQLEVGSTANTYIPTTTTAVYGTPTISFSGVAGLGLQSDGSLYVQPAGTGALQAQATTSSATGGNARGANAVDFQTLRSVNSMVASATGSVIVGGQNNTSSAYTAFLGAGANSYAQGSNSFVGAGNGNVVSSNGAYGAVVAGNSNTVRNLSGFIGSGASNTAGGYYNFIGAGFTNSGTSESAVTTQSATMNATTAVTLSGSNANIKVGQYITGTSIAIDTYVAAISGTSLTLSKVASGSSTSTLSFYTPHGVVVGGGNNQATGSYSFIGGGGDAGTAANRNVASGDWSTVGGGFVTKATGKWSTAVGGIGNTASGEGSVVVGGGSYSGGGAGNTASSISSFVGAGYANTANGYCSTVVGGSSNTASNNYSFVGGGAGNSANTAGTAILGGFNGTARSIEGMQAIPACNSPIASTQGASQAALLILGVQTTDATATVLRSNTSAASTTNQIILPNNSAYAFKGTVIANVTGAANGASWSFEGAIMRGANAASTVLIGTPAINRVASTSGASAWTIALTADTSNGGLAVTVTGAASTTIRFVAKVETTEVTF